MSEEVDARVTPSLHPAVVRNLEGYDDETRPYLGQVETAFSTAYEGLRQVHDARDAAKQNPTWNDAQQVIQTQDFADKVFSRIARHMDAAKANLDKSIGALEDQLSGPIATKGAQSVAAEIRQYAKGLQSSPRMAFIQKAIEGGDETTATAVLGAPAYLSGIDPKTQEVFTRMWHERTAPAVAKRVKAMKAARDLVEARGPLVFGQMEKAVGMRPDKVQALRDAKTAAEQAFVLRDA